MFNEFYNETQDAIAIIEELCQQKTAPNSENYKTIYRMVHTIKGNSMFLEENEHCGLQKMIELIHLYEHYLDHLTDNHCDNSICSETTLLFSDALMDFCDSGISQEPTGYNNIIKRIQMKIQQSNINPTINLIWDVIDFLQHEQNLEVVLEKILFLNNSNLIDPDVKLLLNNIHYHSLQTKRSNNNICSSCIIKAIDSTLCHICISVKRHRDLGNNHHHSIIHQQFINLCVSCQTQNNESLYNTDVGMMTR